MQSADVIGRWLLAGALALVTSQVGAQTLDEVSTAVQGDDVVVHVGFTGPVRLVQQSPAAPARLLQLQIELLAPDEAALNQPTAESRRVAASARVPELSLLLNAAPRQRQRLMTLQLGEVTEVRSRQGANPKVIDIVLVGKGVPRPALQASEQRYAVKLASSASKAQEGLASIPKQFQNFEVFNTRSEAGGLSTYEVNLGYFSTQADAEAARTSLLARFPQAAVVDVIEMRAQSLKSAAQPTQETQERAATAPEQSAQAAPEATPLGTPEVEAQATQLMSASREAVTQGQTETAIGKLNQLLLLPPNSATQDAQEMIGIAWERSGNLARAKMEYELYMKLFKGSEGEQRVAQRLASMGVAPTPASTTSGVAAAAPGKEASGIKYSGNVAEYYFGGKSRSQSLVNLDSGIDQATLTKTTESALVTNIDLGARYTTDDSDIRAVVRGTGSTNLTATSKNTSSLNAAFVDYRQKSSGLAARVGRQSPINGGLLGVFDGISLTYPVRPGIRVNLMGGVPANPLVATPDERLLAGMVEVDSILENLSGDMYIMNQTTQGITNRRTIGTEARYSSQRGSLYALLDYDQLFSAVNAVTLQGSVQGPAQTSFTLLVDSRRAPSLQMTNALISSGAASLKDLLQVQALSLGEVLDRARVTSAQARQVLLSASKPLGEKWQMTGDVRFSDIGALPAVGNFEATPATGAQYGLSLQLTGSNIYSKRDINNFNLSLLSTPLFKGTQLAYNNLTGFFDNKLTLEPSIRVYAQHDSLGSKMTRITPGLRSSYNVSKRTSVMAEGLLEHSKNEGTTNHDTTNSVFFYMGVRYELF